MPIPFPNISANTKIVSSSGKATNEFIGYISSLNSFLSNLLAQDGYKIPTVNNKSAESVESNSTKNIQNKFIYSNDVSIPSTVSSKVSKYMLMNPDTKKFEYILTQERST